MAETRMMCLGASLIGIAALLIVVALLRAGGLTPLPPVISAPVIKAQPTIEEIVPPAPSPAPSPPSNERVDLEEIFTTIMPPAEPPAPRTVAQVVKPIAVRRPPNRCARYLRPITCPRPVGILDDMEAKNAACAARANARIVAARNCLTHR